MGRARIVDLSVLLVAGVAFIANAGSAGPYFNALAAQSPTLFQAGVQDLAFAAESTAAAFAEGRRRAATEETAVQSTAPTPPAPDTRDQDTGDWLDLSWLTPTDWLFAAADWLDPAGWFEAQDPSAPEVDLRVGNEAPVTTEPQAQAPQAPMPTVRSMMHPRDEAAQRPAAGAPSYRIVTAPSEEAAPITGSLPDNPSTPVTWLAGAAVPAGMSNVLLTGTNVSNQPLEDIQATLKPDSGATPTGLDNVTLSLRVEGPDGTAVPGASVPPGARFHLEAAGLSNDAANELGAAIVSFAYSQGGRRRTSIMYLKQTALGGALDGGTEPQ
ncbi:hypothetical protein AUC70_07480 [Methyloceanibacter stevinii]|uniref:Uncharacterized protein n=1 Tax=Methyloceanibacter stevinii TaxID=1774970 RepID=A0A1E3VLU9_9HYPH|nr:hypothetical protein [Methyloceanibacter stevinii]ODR94484.1 hypothetical protein AUC70_07480 [Methyloceanibacter stevinii]